MKFSYISCVLDHFRLVYSIIVCDPSSISTYVTVSWKSFTNHISVQLSFYETRCKYLVLLTLGNDLRVERPRVTLYVKMWWKIVKLYRKAHFYNILECRKYTL